MRARTAQDDKIFLAAGQSTWVTLLVQDASSAFQNLGAQRVGNLLRSVKRSRNLDNPYDTLTATVRREIFKWSLAPYVSASPLNALGGGTKLIKMNVPVRVYIQTCPLGQNPQNVAPAAPWVWLFDGEVDMPDSGPDPMTLACSDLSARLGRMWIKSDIMYGVWQKSKRVIANYTVVATALATNGANNPDAPTGPWWQAQGTFTTGATEPAWPASPTPGTTTVSDNGGTWKCIAGPTGTPLETQIQMLLDDNAGVGVWTLNTPAPSSVVCVPYIQGGMSVLDAVSKVADVAGWICRYLFDDASGTFKLTFFDPKRTTTTSLYTIPANKYSPISSFKEDIAFVRNDVDVYFYDRATLDSSGNPKLSKVNSQDAASIAQNGDLYQSVALGATSPVNTTAVAQSMANNIKSDLCIAPVVTSVSLEFAYWFDMPDLITLSANGLQFDTDQKLAIFSIDDNFTGKESTTTLGLRGTPSSGHKRWHSKFSGPGRNGGAQKTSNAMPPLSVTTGAAIRGAKFAFAIPSSKGGRYDISELHIQAGAGAFTPSSSTRYAVSRSGYFFVGDLTPNVLYSARIVHLDILGNPSDPGTQVTFTTDQVQTADIATGAVTPTTLAPELRQSFKKKTTIVSTLTNDGTLNPWNLSVFDSQSIFSAGTFTPVANTFARVRAQLQIRGALITPGCRGQLYLLAAGVVIYCSPFVFATESGDALNQPEILAVLDTCYPFLSGVAYTVAGRVLDADGTLIANQLIASERGVVGGAGGRTILASGNSALVSVGQEYLDPTGINGHVYRVTTGGTTAGIGARPTYPTGDYSTITDGTAVFTEDGSTGKRPGSFIELLPGGY